MSEDKLNLDQEKELRVSDLFLSLINYKAITLISLFIPLMISIIYLLNREIYYEAEIEIFENKMIEELVINFKNGLEPGTVVIYGENILGTLDKDNSDTNPPYRFYELNHILYKAFKKRDYFVGLFSSNKNRTYFQDLINKYAQTHENKILYIIGDTLKCHSDIEIETNNFNGKLNTIKNILRLQNPSVKIKKSKISCS